MYVLNTNLEIEGALQLEQDHQWLPTKEFCTHELIYLYTYMPLYKL